MFIFCRLEYDRIADIQSSSNLVRENKNKPCMVKITLGPDFKSPHIGIVSDCSKIEVFINEMEEYFRLDDGELVDDFNGIKTYYSVIPLKSAVDAIILKVRAVHNSIINLFNFFLLLKFITSSDSVWIYGIHAYIQKQSLNIFKPKIDMEDVQRRLSEMPTDLSDSATRCKNFLNMHMSASRSAEPPNMESLMSFINSKMKIDEMKGNGLSLESNLNTSGCEESSKTSPTSSSTSFSIDMAKMYFDTQIQAAEQRITTIIEKRIEDLEHRQMQKLDQIILMIQSITT